MSQKLWTIVAHVRKRGAEGIFYYKEFVTFGENAKNAWFDEFGEDWELHHFICIHERSVAPNV